MDCIAVSVRLALVATLITWAAPSGAISSPAPGVQDGAAKIAQGALNSVHQQTTDTATGVTCGYGDTTLGPSFDWCIRKNPNGFDASRVMYLLHGTQGHVRTILDAYWYLDAMLAMRVVYGVAEPVSIAVSFGETWTTTDLPSSYVAGSPNLYRFFTDRLMPYLENRALGGAKPATRQILSMSMGSYNGGGLITRRPDLFTRAALLCPAWFTISKFSSPAERAAYLSRNALANADSVNTGVHLLGQDEGTDPVVGQPRWNANDPLQLIDSMRSRTGAATPFLVAYNLADTYGFKEGAKAFAAKARAGGFPTQEIFNAARHCDITADMSDAVAKFMANP